MFVNKWDSETIVMFDEMNKPGRVITGTIILDVYASHGKNKKPTKKVKQTKLTSIPTDHAYKAVSLINAGYFARQQAANF